MLEILKQIVAGALSVVALAVLPGTTNYQLNSYGFGSGGVANSSTPNYALEGISGEVGSSANSTTTYTQNNGTVATQQANVPTAPTFDNPSNYYNKLRLIINTASNPSDAKFAVAISSDNFVTTQYVQNDATVGSALGTEDYLTYAGWGSGTGTLVIGLISNTTYKVKVKATQGKFTESAYGPTASAATVSSSLTFALSTTSQPSPPFSINIGSLLPATVTTASDNIIIDITANGETGSNVYVRSQNGGLSSTAGAYTIVSASADLASANEGFGLQSASVSQTSGGPLVALSPYNLASGNVGLLDSSLRALFSASSAIVGGHGTAALKAKASSSTPSANDYSDILTIVAAANY